MYDAPGHGRHLSPLDLVSSSQCELELRLFSLAASRRDMQATERGSKHNFFLWVTVNFLATVVLVFANKRLLSHPALRGAPVLFVAYHCFLTGVTLAFVSIPRIGLFQRKDMALKDVMPLAVVFAVHICVTNWSLVRCMPPSQPLLT